VKSRSNFSVLLFPLFALLAGCGSDEPFQAEDVGTEPDWNGPGGSSSSSSSSSGGGSGTFLPASNFDAMCAAPRPDSGDTPGTATDENNWLRSWTNDTYLWYSEVAYPNPASYATLAYFDLLKTNATTASGQAKDKFHFTYDTDDWIALSQGAPVASYGALFEILAPTPPRNIMVAFSEVATPADGFLFRGDKILQVDGQDAVNGNSQAVVDALNAGLFPDNASTPHTFLVQNGAGVQRTVTLTPEFIPTDPVPDWTVFNTPTGDVGYILFTDHIATAEGWLFDAINDMVDAQVTDLIIDMRYNGGGYLDIASELSYMVGNTTLTNGQNFEKLVFNAKHPTTDPVTGEPIVPTPFHKTSQGFDPTLPSGTALPTLNLNRVYIITGSGTCSASESVINSLRGVGVTVYLIGSTTCGKPYGFYPTDNCGTTYFSIQFRGENAANFGDYTDGFSPANTAANKGTSVPGCSVADDFSHELFDPAEGRTAAALQFRAGNNQTAACPTASGSSDPRLTKASFQDAPDRSLWVSKPAARMNRIMRKH
jgi:carboxyl-terminal processing protease